MKRPRWWNGATFRYEERRWSDHGGDGAFDRSRRALLALWPFAAMTAALMVAAAAVFSVVNIADQRDHLVAAGKDAAVAARQANFAARAAKVASDGNQRLLEEQKPCDPGDPPESPGCVRDARMAAQVTAVVDRINAALAQGIAAHDLNTHETHEELRRRIAGATAPIPRPPTPPPAVEPVPPSPPLAPPVAPTTPTTTCARLPNGKCRK